MRKIDLACIIDDDPIFIFGIKKMMELVDFCNAFMIYKNGQEALNNLKAIVSSGEQIPDVILLDLNMPIVDGWQFLDEFIKIPSSKEIVIYIVSSSIDPKDILKAKSYNYVKNYVVKPIKTKDLKNILADFQLN